VPKIIVGIDESDRAKDAVALAAQLASGSGAELVLVCAYPYDDRPARASNAEFRRSLRADAEQSIRRAQEGIPDLPVVSSRAIADLSPAKAIQTMSTSEDASLIVIGSSHRGGVGRVFAGTTAERLLHGAPCPVAVAPTGFHAQDEHDIETIAVAYDRSDEAKSALLAATAIAPALGARLRVVEVIEAPWIGSPALMASPVYDSTLSAEIEQAACDHLAEVVAALPENVKAEPVAIVGDPQRELAAETRSVDLMIAGSRGYGPHRSVLLGGVSGRLVRDASCPVLVVPRGIATPLEVCGAALIVNAMRVSTRLRCGGDPMCAGPAAATLAPCQ
jgi:nucleotide-binding universal stress UspA family protein